jgi:imidazolonepropionase
VIESAKRSHTVDIVSNYCGAHSVPKGSTAEEATKDIIERQLPALAALREAGELSVDQIDVFCEKGVFSTESSRAILEAGLKQGLAINFHGDELNYTGSCEMGADIGATAISHVEHVSEDGIKRMADKDVAAVLLPTTAYVLRITPPPARALVDGGVIVALGSDFNPNAHCSSMPHVMNLACVTMKMTVNEALVAATLNAAKALGKSAEFGSIEAGKRGDMVVVAASQWEHLVYQMGTAAVKEVIKNGEVVFRK